jgi:hypothetical protein
MRNYIIHLRPRGENLRERRKHLSSLDLLSRHFYICCTHTQKKMLSIAQHMEEKKPRGVKKAARFSFIQRHARKSEWLLSNYRAASSSKKRAADLQFIIGVASFVGAACAVAVGKCQATLSRRFFRLSRSSLAREVLFCIWPFVTPAGTAPAYQREFGFYNVCFINEWVRLARCLSRVFFVRREPKVLICQSFPRVLIVNRAAHVEQKCAVH